MAKRKSPYHQSESRVLQETWVYLMCLAFYVILSKFGISDQPNVRRTQVDKGIPGPVKTIVSTQVPFGKAAETLVHTLYFWCNVSMWFPSAFKGSTGRTELFFNMNPVFGVGFLYICHCAAFVPETWMVWTAFISPFVWIDVWLWVQIFRGMAWAFAAALAYGIYWFLTHIN